MIPILEREAMQLSSKFRDVDHRLCVSKHNRHARLAHNDREADVV